jgi:hypothetical protein
MIRVLWIRFVPAGNIYTSAEQAGRFFEMFLSGGQYQGKQIMSPRTVFRSTYPPQ